METKGEEWLKTVEVVFDNYWASDEGEARKATSSKAHYASVGGAATKAKCP